MHPKPKKRLGQNFLVDAHAQERIVRACGFSSHDVVLEIGPGCGVMTRLLSRVVSEVYAVELDRSLCLLLDDKFSGHGKVAIFQGDILKFDFNKYFPDPLKKIKVFGNIPYYISSPIIEYLLSNKSKIEKILLTVQKEFAARVAASPGTKEYGAFSCFVQYHAQPRILATIKRNSFKPVPRVDSCLLELSIRTHPEPTVRDEKLLFSLIRTAFNQRRKTLANSLKGKVPAAVLKEFFLVNSVDSRVRPEQLSLAAFARLSDLIKK
ncbi:MAG: 16S rRNA (adenine(1518)-N(6)/adenine(1519)-N(6))-dimethyltransferase RsmA [Candidatus Omnitrophica bacterium]|nr:16S rRNA (adenine(1518)-N(6)/adenine(1519)-N(6))-dimethyltransferase RsmA [Candidatus Omnitrophota bacterium]